MNANQFRWTPWRIAELRRRVENKESAAEIAKALGPGFTRNAVIGKARRAGMRLDSDGRAHLRESLPVKVTTQRIKTPRIKREPTHPKKPKLSFPWFPKMPKIAPLSPTPEPAVFTPRTTPLVSIMELKDGVCKFPIGDPRDDDFGFCGAQTPDDGGPYCCGHRLIAYTGKSSSAPAKPFYLRFMGNVIHEAAE